jgi:FkbM family methyltransferase
MLRRLGWDVVRFPSPPQPPPVTPTWAAIRRLDIRTVIDVGALDGDTARLYREIWPHAALHCFEPQVAQYALLKEWAARQQPSVHTYGFALGAAPTTATMFSVQDRPQHTSMVRDFRSSVDSPNRSEQPTRVERMDAVLDAAELESGILVKIDVEGYEREVLRGAAQVLDRAAVCIIEVNDALIEVGAADIAEIAATMRGHGLMFAGMLDQHFNRNRRLYRGDAIFADWSRCAPRA